MFRYTQIMYCLQEESTDVELSQVFTCLKMCQYPQIIYYQCALKAFLTLPNFISKKMVLFRFSNHLASTGSTILLDATLQALILCVHFFKCSGFFYSSYNA